MMLVGQAGVRAANDGTSRKFMVKSTATVFRKKVCSGCSENDCPDDPHHSDELCRGKASDLFGELTGIAVLLTMLRTSTLALT